METAFRGVSTVYVYSYRHLLEKRPNYTYILSCCAPKQNVNGSPQLSFGVDPNCPPHPHPVSLPSPLPDVIQTALSRLEQEISTTLNSTSIVNEYIIILVHTIVTTLLSWCSDSVLLCHPQPGISASMVYMGREIWSKGFGVKSRSGGSQPPDHNTIFRIGSISKVFAVCENVSYISY